MSTLTGLSTLEAAAILAKNGPNTFISKRESSTFRLLLSQFRNPIILMLFVATVISMFAGEYTDGVIILAIIIPSGLLGFWQENRASKTMAALMNQVQIHADVLRDGIEIEIPIEEIVVGDLVLLQVGDMVPADLQLVSAESLMVDESVLTGESFPREKLAGNIDEEKPLSERVSELFSGTHVVSGMGRGVVVKTGRDTEFGALAQEVSSRDVTTGFERGTNAFGMLLLRTMLLLVSALFVANMILHRPILDSLLFSLALAVGLTPQLLPVIISVSLAAGARRMAEKQVLIKRLDAIEDFGLMNILCTDKTGTITAGVVNLDGAVDSHGNSSEVVLRLAYLNSKLQKGYENPLDAAIISSAGNRYPEVPILDELPFDFERRRLSILVSDSESMIISKGAFENVLQVCTNVRSGNEVKDMDSQREELTALFEKLSSEGNRVLAVATRRMPGASNIYKGDENQMTFEGLLIFQDPLKPDARQATEELAVLGIDLCLITGDNRLIARSIANQVGMSVEIILTGKDISELSEHDLVNSVQKCKVFAEVDPIQKEQIILALRKAGATVGYFGDGINDAAALHAADVGISVDSAVDVAKNAASIVLLNKDLRVISEGVRLGRRTFVNTMKYIRVSISASFGNVVSMAIADVFLPFLPLLPMQILLLNFLTDFPHLAISGDTVDEELITKPPTWNIKSIRKFMILFGLLSSIFDLAAFVVLRVGFHASETLFRSGWFVESTLTELSVMMILRTNRRFWKSRPGKGLFWASAAIAVITITIPFTSLGSLIGLSVIHLPLLFILFLLIVVYIALNELAKKYWTK